MTRKQYIRVLYKWHVEVLDMGEISMPPEEIIRRKKQRLELLYSFTDNQLHDLFMMHIEQRA